MVLIFMSFFGLSLSLSLSLSLRLWKIMIINAILYVLIMKIEYYYLYLSHLAKLKYEVGLHVYNCIYDVIQVILALRLTMEKPITLSFDFFLQNMSDMLYKI